MRYIVAAVALLTLTACAAQQPPPVMTWAARGAPTMSQEQALAECRYDIVKDKNNFDRLFLLSGQPAITAGGHVQGLSQQGAGMFQLCMQAKGYEQAGFVPHNASGQS
jgi:hypothetical protein